MYAAPYILAGPTEQVVVLALAAGAALCALIWSVLAGLRGRSALPPLALLGGLIAVLMAPFWNINLQFVLATNTEPVVFSAFGRPIPLYLAFAYSAFLGWGSYLGYRLIKEGATRGQLLALAAAFFVADGVIEMAGAQVGLWIYYGYPVWSPFGWPIYVGVMNAAVPLLGGWLLVVLDRRLRGLVKGVAVLAIPAAYGGVYVAAGWPTWVASNAAVGPVTLWLAGGATILISAGVCWLVADANGGEAPPPGPVIPSGSPSSDPFPLDSPLRRLAQPR